MTLPPGTILASGLREVDAALRALPPDKTAALVVSTRLQDGEVITRTGFAVKVGEQWAFGGEAETDWHEDHGATVFVRWAK